MAARERKGTFSDIRLPVAGSYLRPVSRGPLVLAAAVIVVAAAGYVAFDFFVRDKAFVSNGPLASSHAVDEDDCAACHDPFHQVTSERCSVCHEKHGDRLGVYTWAAHYVYRSGDLGRVSAHEKETSCAACHPEHRGREARITRVGDARCRACHDFRSFNQGHPAFDASESDETETLHFTHIHHVRELMKREELVDVEKSCLYCHNARPDGKSFEPLSFDDHCDACHLVTTDRTPALPVATGDAPGVKTLDEIRRRRAPGTQWALFMSSGEFRNLGDEVVKSPIHHADPWILENLRRLRHRLYGDSGLADLLQVSADAPPGELPALYREAIETLESYAQGLRSRPEREVQAELAKIEDLLRDLRHALDDPLTPLDATRFTLALGERRPEVSDAEAAAIGTLVDDLTAPCRPCHVVENATIARVTKDQRELTRANFDHRAHILQKRCLDCHDRIPIAEHLNLAVKEEIDPKIDRAAILNLPTIDTCRECHTADQASNRCVTCHYFHPNKSRRSEMLLYLESSQEQEE